MLLPLYDEEHTHGRTGGRITVLLIFLNLIAFFFQVTQNAMTEPFVLVPAQIHGHWWTLITNTFMHGGPAHIIGNMWFLYIFGDNVEDHMGSFNFLWFYLACGFLSSVAEVFCYPHSYSHFLGASGAISGVMAAYFFLYPDAKVRTMVGAWFFHAWLPAWVLLGGWFAMQVFSQMMDPTMSAGVSFSAHICGFAAGLLLCSIIFPKPAVYK